MVLSVVVRYTISLGLVIVGACVGRSVGLADGLGVAPGSVGVNVGPSDASAVGISEATAVGPLDGTDVGASDATTVGPADGTDVGASDATCVGASDAACVGASVASTTGTSVTSVPSVGVSVSLFPTTTSSCNHLLDLLPGNSCLGGHGYT